MFLKFFIRLGVKQEACRKNLPVGTLFARFAGKMTTMKRIVLLLLAACLALTACSTVRKASQASMEDSDPWTGCSTADITLTMGYPNHITEDGKGGSVLVYESIPDQDSPDYDILDPDASSRNRNYACFFVDEEGTCYRVEANYDLPAAPQSDYSEDRSSLWIDLLITIPLLALSLLL